MLLAAALKYEALVRSEPRIRFHKCHVFSFSTEAVLSLGLEVGVVGGCSTNCIRGGPLRGPTPYPGIYHF